MTKTITTRLKVIGAPGLKLRAEAACVDGYDMVADGSDHFPTRYLVIDIPNFHLWTSPEPFYNSMMKLSRRWKSA